MAWMERYADIKDGVSVNLLAPQRLYSAAYHILGVLQGELEHRNSEARLEGVSLTVPLMLIEPQVLLTVGPDLLQKLEEGHKLLFSVSGQRITWDDDDVLDALSLDSSIDERYEELGEVFEYSKKIEWA
ncbi:hypothetical protein Tco_1334696 [Tanacetum coccineum]